MTGPGTNSYLVGSSGGVAVIDPGPLDHGHIALLLGTAEGLGGIAAILVTHSHEDHAPAAEALSRAAGGAPILAFGGREEGGLRVDRPLGDSDLVEVGERRLRAIHTPGHASDHLCYATVEPPILLFSGDHIMGGSTVVVAPPDGDMAAYLSSLERLAAEKPPFEAIAPGHGPLLAHPGEVIEGYIRHRLDRERTILAFLAERAGKPSTVEEIVLGVYKDVARELHPVARYSVWAHLLKLRREHKADADDPSGLGTRWWSL
jgi:glyoxylase-like metal-dependent hydrolase (beta-lactamase superfamily II)